MSSHFHPATTPLRPSRPTLAVTAILVAVAVNLTLLGVLHLLQRNPPVASTEPTYDLTVLDLVELPQPVDPPSLAREPVPSASSAAAGSEAAPALHALPTPALPPPPRTAPPPMALDLPTTTLAMDLQALAPLPPRELPQPEVAPVVAAPTMPTTSVATAPAAPDPSPVKIAPSPTGTAASQAPAGQHQGGPASIPAGDANGPSAPGPASPGAGNATGMGNTEPTVLHRVEPRYPEAARRQGVEGEVTVRFTVTARGEVRDTSVVRASSQRFEQAALGAVARWRFTPGQRGGVATPSVCEITFRFRIDK